MKSEILDLSPASGRRSKIDAWPMVRLEDVCEKITDGTHRSPPNGSKGIPYITAKNIRRFSIDLSDLTCVSPEHHAEIYGRCDPKKGDVLYIKDGATMGIAAVNPLDFEFSMLSSVALIRPNKSKLDAHFLVAWLNSPDVYRGVVEQQSGSAIKRMILSQIKDMKIPLPPLPEQKRIAALLTDQLAAVDRARLAAEQQLAAAGAMLSSYLNQLFQSDMITRWPTERIGKVLKLRKEIVHPHDNPRGPATFVGLEHIQPNTGERIGSIELEMSELTGRKPRFHSGDIVYGYLRPYLNKLWIADFDGLCSVDQFAFEPNLHKIHREFIAWFMRSPQFLSRSKILTTTGQLPRIGTGEIAAVEFNLPPISEQHRVAKQVADFFENYQHMTASCREQIESLRRLPSSLLRDAFSKG